MNAKVSSQRSATQQLNLASGTARARGGAPILCALVGILLASAGHAAVYYVDVGSGSDSNNGASQTGAWAHLPGTVGFTGSGWVTLQNGDTIYVKGGTINNVQVKFTSSSYNGSNALDSIKVVSGHLAPTPWGTARAIFDEQNTRTYGLWVGSGNGLTIDGFEVRNIKSGAAGPGFDDQNGSSCVLVGGAYAANSSTIRRCYLHDALRDAVDRGHGIETDGAAGSTNLVIEMNAIGPNIGTKGIEIQHIDWSVLRQNFITGTGDHGITLTANRCDVSGNVVYMKPPYAHEPVFGIKVNNNYNDVWNNVVYQDVQTTTGSISNDLEGIGTLNNASYNRIFFNTVINCSDLAFNRTGAGISLADENATGTRNDVQNCIVAFCKNNIGGSWSSVQVYLGTGAGSDSLKYCNLWSGGSSDTVCAYNSGSGYSFYTTANAFTASPIGNGNTFQNLTQLNPQFKGGALPSSLDANYRPNTTYFQLATNAPEAITSTGNALLGTSTNGYSSTASKFSADIMGAPRAKWSMGAYEFVAQNVLPPPTNLRLAQNP